MASPEPQHTGPPEGQQPGPWGPRVLLRLRWQSDMVTLLAGVLATTDDVLEVSFGEEPVPQGLLAPGRLAGMREPGGRERQGQLLLVRPGTPPIAIFRLLGDAAERRRAHTRYIPIEPLGVTIAQVVAGRALAGQAVLLDISSGGLGFITAQPVARGAAIHVRIPTGAPGAVITLPAQVLWTAPLTRYKRCGAVFANDPGPQLDPLIGQALLTEVRLLQFLGSERV